MSTSAQVTWGNQSLTVTPEGFRWQQANGEVLEGPWSRVNAVMTFVASSSINGVHVGTWQHLGMTFDTGASFTFHSTRPDAFQVAPLAEAYAAPHILPRVEAQLEAGQTVQFGPLSLSKTEVGFKNKRWPLAQVTGHRTFQGHWMLDVGPKDAPKLVVQVMLNKVPNSFAFRALLEKYAPGRDYGDDAPDLGTMFRPSASSHDPRYPAGRTRLLLLGGLVGVGALIGLGVLGVTMWESHQHELAWQANKERLAGFVKTAQAVEVPPGTPFTCDRSVDVAYDLVFALRGPKDVDRPGLLHKDEPFELSDASATVVAPYARPPYFVFGEVLGVTGESKDRRVVTVALRVVDTQTQAVVCSGELAGQFKDTERWSTSFAIADLLVLSMCEHCGARSHVALLEPGAEPPAEPPAPTPSTRAPPKPRAEPTPAATGSLSQAAIQQVVKRHQREVQYCYERELRQNPKLAGKVAVSFTIERSGAVSGAKVGDSTLNNATVERCIVGLVSRWKFPAPQGGAVTVKYPWLFKAG